MPTALRLPVGDVSTPQLLIRPRWVSMAQSACACLHISDLSLWKSVPDPQLWSPWPPTRDPQCLTDRPGAQELKPSPRHTNALRNSALVRFVFESRPMIFWRFAYRFGQNLEICLTIFPTRGFLCFATSCGHVPKLATSIRFCHQMTEELCKAEVRRLASTMSCGSGCVRVPAYLRSLLVKVLSRSSNFEAPDPNSRPTMPNWSARRSGIKAEPSPHERPTKFGISQICLSVPTHDILKVCLSPWAKSRDMPDHLPDTRLSLFRDFLWTCAQTRHQHLSPDDRSSGRLRCAGWPVPCPVMPLREIYIYIHTYIHACMHTYIHTYIHTGCFLK